MTDPPAPATIVATVPRWLERQPRIGETVLVGLSPMDEQYLVVLALVADADPMDETNAHRQLVVDGAEQVAIIRYVRNEAGSQHEVGLRFHAAAASRYGLDVIGVLVVIPEPPTGPGYWYSVRADGVRVRYPIPTPARTEETP